MLKSLLEELPEGCIRPREVQYPKKAVYLAMGYLLIVLLVVFSKKPYILLLALARDNATLRFNSAPILPHIRFRSGWTAAGTVGV